MEYGNRERRSFGGGSRGHGGGGSRGFGGGGGGFRGGGNRGGSGFVPVKEGEELSVVIESVAEKGDGVAKKQGFVIFVPGTKVGDKVKIKVNKVAKKVAFASVIGAFEEGASSESSSSESSSESASEEPAAEETQEEETNYDSAQDSEEF
jgi:23S rRNA (uracil1939-C5)-methyltransferase